MEEEIDYTEQSLCFYDEVHKKCSFTTASPEFYINIKYSCTPTLSDWVVCQDSDEPRPLRSVDWPTDTKLIRLSLDQFSCEEKARKVIGDTIKRWVVWVEYRPLLIDYALEKAREVVEFMPPSHNAVHLNLHVNSQLRHVVDEARAMRSETRRSREEAKAGMVCTVESSIESLESTTLIESGSCLICLEEFVDGGEGVMMPCLHIFHGDCIKKWLRTSHYCPICRFEMPTS
ncbi:Ubiquitin--protein ligase [Handroanthus impetiginosus]|uniref:RING-type E3 ubiquitin transferase n=1 Tax=Handroanthus impetiginosus TaxID=429701 RepID=A0A2G9HHH5_9LAMI|nr:Ubiquitin--protein ligase [Handroanthus impetiginosus]